MKNKRHIKSFNESTENLNISDVSGSYDNGLIHYGMIPSPPFSGAYLKHETE